MRVIKIFLHKRRIRKSRLSILPIIIKKSNFQKRFLPDFDLFWQYSLFIHTLFKTHKFPIKKLSVANPDKFNQTQNYVLCISIYFAFISVFSAFCSALIPHSILKTLAKYVKISFYFARLFEITTSIRCFFMLLPLKLEEKTQINWICAFRNRIATALMILW